MLALPGTNRASSSLQPDPAGDTVEFSLVVSISSKFMLVSCHDNSSASTRSLRFNYDEQSISISSCRLENPFSNSIVTTDLDTSNARILPWQPLQAIIQLKTKHQHDLPLPFPIQTMNHLFHGTHVHVLPTTLAFTQQLHRLSIRILHLSHRHITSFLATDPD